MSDARMAPKVAIVAHTASTRFGGEAMLPWHYFRFLRARGVEAHLVIHGRTRDELSALLPDDVDRMHFVPDRWFHKLLHRIGAPLPSRVNDNSFAMLLHFAAIVLMIAALLSQSSQAGFALAAYFATAAIVAIFWAFPMPVAGAGPSHAIGFGIAIGWLAAHRQRGPAPT